MKTIHHVVDADVAAVAVWKALTERDQLAGWWSTSVETDQAAVGGRVRFTFDGDFNPVMEITGISDQRQLSWRCIEGHEPWRDNTFVFELVSGDDGGTRLRFTQNYAVELSDDAYGIYNYNWGYYLESLRLLCTTGAGKPYQPTSG